MYLRESSICCYCRRSLSRTRYSSLEAASSEGKIPPGSDGPAQLGIQHLDGVGGMNDPPGSPRKGKERDHQVPITAPPQCDFRIFSAPPAGFEPIQRGLDRRSTGCPIDRFEHPRDSFCRLSRRRSSWIGGSGVRCRSGTMVYGNAALIASGKPFSPSMTAIRVSDRPRFFTSFITAARTWRLRSVQSRCRESLLCVGLDATPIGSSAASGLTSTKMGQSVHWKTASTAHSTDTRSRLTYSDVWAVGGS